MPDPRGPMSSLPLDKRYIEFRESTRAVFAEYPALEGLRHFVFKGLLTRRRGAGPLHWVKHHLRPFHQRHRTVVATRSTDVLVLLDHPRAADNDTVAALSAEFQRCNLMVQLVSTARDRSLPVASTPLRWPAQAVTAPWAEGAWDGLCRAEPALRDRDLRRAFFQATSTAHAVQQETHRLIRELGVRVVLNWSTQSVVGASFVTAGRSDCHSVLLQHGMVQTFFTPVIADIMITWGKSSSDSLERLGAPPDRLVPLGSPHHDRMPRFAAGKNARATLCRKLGIAERSTMVFFSNGNDFDRNGTAPIECAQWLAAAARELGDEANIVVRLHPNEDGSLYRDCARLRITKGEPDLDTTLAGADSIGSLCSTALYEALLYGKTAWQFFADGWPDLADNWKTGYARRIDSPLALVRALRNSIDNPNAEADVPEVARVFANHGRAAQTIASFVAGLLDSSPPDVQTEAPGPES